MMLADEFEFDVSQLHAYRLPPSSTWLVKNKSEAEGIKKSLSPKSELGVCEPPKQMLSKTPGSSFTRLVQGKNMTRWKGKDTVYIFVLSNHNI